MNHTYVDTHCHLDRFSDPQLTLEAANDAGVSMIAVTESPSMFRTLLLTLGERDCLSIALGIHPLRAHTVDDFGYEMFAEMLGRTEFVGEVGIDGSRSGKETLSLQAALFERILSEPAIESKVLTVHSRGAEAETIERLESTKVTAILHWYTGSLRNLDRALDAGLWFSVNAAMLRSKSGRSIIAALPPDRVLTETDGPYARSEPKDVPSIVRELANLWGQDVEETSATVMRNFVRVRSSATQKTLRADPFRSGRLPI